MTLNHCFFVSIVLKLSKHDVHEYVIVMLLAKIEQLKTKFFSLISSSNIL